MIIINDNAVVAQEKLWTNKKIKGKDKTVRWYGPVLRYQGTFRFLHVTPAHAVKIVLEIP